MKHIKNTAESLHQLIDELTKSYSGDKWANGLNGRAIPSRQAVSRIMAALKSLLFPGFYDAIELDPQRIAPQTGERLFAAFQLLSDQIERGICHACNEENDSSHCLMHNNCRERSQEISLKMLQQLPAIREQLRLDIQAIYDGDPAAHHMSEIILAYPGLNAITAYRLAHVLHKSEVPLIPRIMAELVHQETGIDIHPGASIGHSLCIDHGTGIVIGETTIIGNNVKIYHGVTLGAFSVSKNQQSIKRHPTIEDGVTIYSNATILGGDTIVGRNSVIGANVWLTESVPEKSIIKP